MAISTDNQPIGKRPLENGLSENGKEEANDKPDDQANDLKSGDMLSVSHDFGPNFIMLPTNNQIKELQTVLRDK